MYIPDYHKLNSMTKYPSILTYHEIGDKGKLKEERTTDFGGHIVYLYEKVDGTNSRIILALKDGKVQDFFIGTREELIYAYGDRIVNPELGVVGTLLDKALYLMSHLSIPDEDYTGLIILYLEVYGGALNASKQYTTTKSMSYRLFDVAFINEQTVNSLIVMPIEKIAGWRDRGNQNFMTRSSLELFAVDNDLPMVPYIGVIPGDEMPKSILGAYYLLSNYPYTAAGIDREKGYNEGLVCRTADRKQIAKLRFEDYERTIPFGSKIVR